MLAKTPHRGVIAPVRRPQPANPAPFLIDQDGCVFPLNGVAQAVREIADLSRGIYIAPKKDETKRIGIPKQGTFIGSQSEP